MEWRSCDSPPRTRDGYARPGRYLVEVWDNRGPGQITIAEYAPGFGSTDQSSWRIPGDYKNTFIRRWAEVGGMNE